MVHCESVQVTYTSGRQVPKIAVPENACDCHFHIFDPVIYPYLETDVRNQPPATVPMWKKLRQRLGLTRGVIVTPSAYGFDNAPTLNALQELGDDARAVVVIPPDISDGELEKMHTLGVRGVRFNVIKSPPKDPAVIERLAARIHEFGWHVQFWLSADSYVPMRPLFEKLPNQVVFDHFANIPLPQGEKHPAFAVVRDLMHAGKAWVKLSGVYFVSAKGDPTYDDVVPLGQAFVREAPDRLVWGTDWPHVTPGERRYPWPDIAAIMDLMADIAPDEAVRNAIFVDNAATLYGF